MILTITDFGKITEPKIGFDVTINDKQIFVPLSDLQEVDENYMMFYSDSFYYRDEIMEMLDEAINLGVIKVK